MSAVNTESIPPSHTNGVIEDGYDEDEKTKVRPADIDADMREMERRKRVELIMNSRLFREELERIIESQMKAGNNSAGLLQQISDMVGTNYGMNNHLFKGSSCAAPINDIRGVEAMGYAKGEKILRCKLAALFRLIDLYGWSQHIYNHVTARLSQKEEHFLVNPYGLLYSEVTASSLVKVDMQGNVIESGTTNFSVNVTGFQLHAAIYAARPDLKCIVHLHTPSVLAVSSLKYGLLPICQEAAVIGDVSHHTYIGIPNEPEERDKIVRNLGPNNKVIFLTNHGALCCGETIEETFFYAYNTVNACETQLRVLPLGKDNVVLLSEETRKSMYDMARKIPDNISPPVSHVPSATERRWRIGGLEFEALMRMLDNAGFRTGYVYRQPLIKGELPRPRNDVEVPPAVSSLGYLFEEEELYKGQWRKALGGKGNDRIRWLNSPNVYQKVEILETGTSDPKKITKWVDANNEEWVADGSPSHTSTPVKIENALQFVPKNTNPKEFKKLQQQIKENRRADKITSGPQSHILEGVSWEEAKKLQDANMSGTSDQVILVGAASKGIIQREYQHNATVYKTPYAKNPFDAITDEEIENYKKDITRKQRGDSYYDEDESDALSSSLPPSGKRQNNRDTSDSEDKSLMHEMRVIQIETTTVPKASQAEVVLSDDKSKRKLSKNQAATKAFIKENYDFYSEELRKFIVRIWEIKKMRPILKRIGESMRPLRSLVCEKDDDSPLSSYPPKMNLQLEQIARELMTRFNQGSVFKQRSVRPAFLPSAPESPEFHDISYKSTSFDCSDTEITTLIELPSSHHHRRCSRGSLESVHDFSSDPTTEDEEEPTSLEKDYFLSLSSCIGHEYENPEESNEMNTSMARTNVSDDTSLDEETVVCKRKDDEFNDEEKDDFSDCSLPSSLMNDDPENEEDVEWNTYESLNDLDDDYNIHEKKPKQDEECVTSFIEKSPIVSRFRPELAVIYEETNNSDLKCCLKSILEDSVVYAEPQCERSDTPDTYVIEEEPSVEYDVWASVNRCIASIDALLEHSKTVKLDRNDSETVSSAVANCFPAFDHNGADSDAHTISDTSLISCLADSTEDLEAFKSDVCFDANDESERVLDSGILMEDIVTCSSEGDYTDMKLSSEIISTGIVVNLSPPGGRTSSGSDEAEDPVWVTQIEKTFDFDVDDFCLNELFVEPVEELSDYLGAVVDTGSDNHCDNLPETSECADSVIESDNFRIDSENDLDPYSFHADDENIATNVSDLDNEHLTGSASSVDSVHTSILIQDRCSDSNLPEDNNINAGVTLKVPETDIIVDTRDDTENLTNTPRQSCDCDQSNVHSNCEICNYIRETIAANIANTKPSQPADFDFDIFDTLIIRILAAHNELPFGVDNTFVENKNVTEIFGESFFDDLNNTAISSEETPVKSIIMGCDKEDFENIPFDEVETNLSMDDDSYICFDCNMMKAAKSDSTTTSIVGILEQESSVNFDEGNTSHVNDRVLPDLSALLDCNGVLCKMIVNDLIVNTYHHENYSQIETGNLEDLVLADASMENKEPKEDLQQEVNFELHDKDVELPSHLLESGLENSEDNVEENNNYLPNDDPNRDIVDEKNDANFDEDDVINEQSKSVGELEVSAESSENVDDVTVLEINTHESYESSKVAREPTECIESPENNDDSNGDHDENSASENNISQKLLESSESINSTKNVDEVATEEQSEPTESENKLEVNSDYNKLFENCDYDLAAEKDVLQELSESSESVPLVENVDDNVTTETGVLQESPECVESSPRNSDDAAVVETMLESDIVFKSSESTELSGNIDDGVAQENNVIGEFVESPKSHDDVSISEDDSVQEPSELAKSPENNDAVVTDENSVVHDPDVFVESSENCDDVSTVGNGREEEPAELVDSSENGNVIDKVENNVANESSKFIDSIENIDHPVPVQNDVIYNPSEELHQYHDEVSIIEDYILQEPSELVKSPENGDDVNGSSKHIDSLENINHCVPVQNNVIYDPMKESSENHDISNVADDIAQEPSEFVESPENSDDIFSESPEYVDSVENINHPAPLQNNVMHDPSKYVELPLENSSNVNVADNDVILESPEFMELAENIENVEIVKNYHIEENSESAKSTEKDVNVETVRNGPADESPKQVEISENDDKHSIESNAHAAEPLDENHPECEPVLLPDNNLLPSAYLINNTATSTHSDEICKDITPAAVVTNDSNEEHSTNSSGEMDEHFVTVSEASIDHSDPPVAIHNIVDEPTLQKDDLPVTEPKPTASPKRNAERKSRNNLKTSFRFTNRKTPVRTSPPIQNSTDDDKKRNNGIDSAASATSSSNSDEKKPKLDQDVTEYSLRLKLRIEWDNQRNSSDSTSKSSSFEDSLNCSESTSEGKRDLRGECDVNIVHPDFKTDYPKFITYEYFSPKVKITRTPKNPAAKKKQTVRKSISLESSPNGRYHRYCHLTADLNANCKTTPKRVPPSSIKSMNQMNAKNCSKNQIPRKVFHPRNTNITTPLKTSTPVLNTAELASKESSLVECLTLNTLSPIINSLEEFELIESLLTSCEN